MSEEMNMEKKNAVKYYNKFQTWLQADLWIGNWEEESAESQSDTGDSSHE